MYPRYGQRMYVLTGSSSLASSPGAAFALGILHAEPATDAEAGPIATSDRGVAGKGRLWQHTLTLLAAPGSDRAKAWTAGLEEAFFRLTEEVGLAEEAASPDQAPT